MDGYITTAHRELADAHRKIMALNSEISDLEKIIAEKREQISVQELRLAYINESIANHGTKADIKAKYEAKVKPVTNQVATVSVVAPAPVVSTAPSVVESSLDPNMRSILEGMIRKLYVLNRTNEVQAILESYDLSDKGIGAATPDIAQMLYSDLKRLSNPAVTA